jgi:hypothetical protein
MRFLTLVAILMGMFAMATLTYSGPSAPISAAWDVMLKTGGLRKRELPPTTRQTEMRGHVFNLWKKWDDAEAKPIVSVNFFLDKPASQRQAGCADSSRCSARRGPWAHSSRWRRLSRRRCSIWSFESWHLPQK